MHRKLKRIRGWILPSMLFFLTVAVLITQLIFPTSGSDRLFAGEAEIYYQALKDAGFPDDYAASLTELHLLHPTWSFSPLLVTKQEAQYTWNYVIEKEHERAYNNIIYSTDTYAAYHHPTNKETYDSGHYQVSKEALEYFMDPRNFLNETDIFQFYSLSGSVSNATSTVEAILKGTFMENAVLENGMTYAQYFVELGELLDINPIFLATKVRQEQGVDGSSPLISGACGDQLLEMNSASDYTEAELRAYNGYYNYFNINATGKGSFDIYLNAIRYAKEKGTADLFDEWGGSASWNTRWKALYGGSYFLANQYIKNYQSTIYLQKFNVDSRADYNFSHQYMATVHGAMSEARMLFQSFSTMDLLDSAAHFVIPVYAEMPQEPCVDPAGGTCSQTVQASKRYEYHSELTDPIRAATTSAPIYLEQEIYSGDLIELNGSVSHKYAVDGLFSSWDGGAWKRVSNGSSLQKRVVCDASENTTHILVIRGTATYQSAAGATIRTNFLYAVIYIHVIARPNVQISYNVGETVTEESHLYGSRVKLPRPESSSFLGWKGSDGSFLSANAEVELKENLAFSAVFADFQHLEGAAIVAYEQSPRLRFSAAMKKSDYDRLCALSSAPVTYTVQLMENDQKTTLNLSEIATTVVYEDAEWVRFDALTAPLRPDAYQTSYSAEFFLNMSYTNGQIEQCAASGTPSVRSANEVAQAALSDQTITYSPTLLSLLRSVAENA